jgi:hypothetical protein
MNHPLVPLAQRNNFVVSLQPLKLRAMDDDWLETSPTLPNGPGANYRARPNLFLQSAQPPSVIEHIIPGGKRARAPDGATDGTSHGIPGIYQQVAAISGYLGWRLMNSVAPHWVKR